MSVFFYTIQNGCIATEDPQYFYDWRHMYDEISAWFFWNILAFAPKRLISSLSVLDSVPKLTRLANRVSSYSPWWRYHIRPDTTQLAISISYHILLGLISSITTTETYLSLWHGEDLHINDL